MIFLVAYWLYIGGVFTVITMAVNFGQRRGFGQQDLLMALLVTNFVGFPATIAFGFLGHYSVQGGVQGLSRSLYATLIPADQPGEFFGFYNMLTKFAHVLGASLVAIAAMVSNDPGFVLLALLPLFVGGGMLLGLVRVVPAPSSRIT